MTTCNTFEMFPDEIILHVCGYLRGADVLYSFFDLNARLNVTIAGYCRYINLLAPTYKPFQHIISCILPQIGPSVRSFVLNGNWKPVLSSSASTLLFGSSLSVIFPQLQRLTLKWFTGEDMSLFLPGLENLSELVVLDIRILNGKIDDSLLTKVLGANNGRLKVVLCDEDSASLNVPEGDEIVSYFNIEEITINVTLNRSFLRLFQFLPNVQRLYVTLEEEIDRPEFAEAFATLSPLLHLIDFQLTSRSLVWTFDEILAFLRIMPSLQRLTLDLITMDERLVKGNHLIEILPSSVTQIHVSIRDYSAVNLETLRASWPDNLPINCLVDDKWQRVLFHTIPYSLRSMTLPAEMSKQMSSGWHWKHMQKVEDLRICNATSLAQILLVMQHFHQLRRLTIRIPDKLEPCPAIPSTKTPVIKLLHLKQLTVSGICPLLCFVKAAPNLDHLTITFDCLKNLLEDEEICQLLQQRITRLDIIHWPNTESDLLQPVSRVFNNLHQIIIQPDDRSTIMDRVVLEICANWYDKRLHWLFIGGSLSDQTKENLRQWLIDHTPPITDDSFGIAYADECLTLWK